MIAAWIVYGLVVSAVLYLAALLMERAARWIGGPTRWVWAGAITLGWTLPVLARRVPERGMAVPASTHERAVSIAAEAGSGMLTGLAGILEGASAALGGVWSQLGSGATAVDLPLTVLWIGAAGSLLSALAITYRRLRIRARAWPVRRLHGHRVRVSDNLGPAVLGVGRSQVVLPRWAVACEPSRRRLIVLHEVEHLRAGDQRLLFAAVVAVALMPWNVFAWWQLRWLRLAVELDCDRRVLRTGAELREYASLLLEAGSRRAASPVMAGAFVHFHSQLGRRIREMTEKRKGPRYLPAAIATAGALVLLVAACEAPVPTDPVELQEITSGKQVTQLDPTDHAELQRILEEEGELTLVVEEVGGDTYVIDQVKLHELREKGHAEMLIGKLKEHGQIKLTLIHEDGTESAHFGEDVQFGDPTSNELVEIKPHAEGDYYFGVEEGATRYELKLRKEATIKELKAVENEPPKHTEDGSQ